MLNWNIHINVGELEYSQFRIHHCFTFSYFSCPIQIFVPTCPIPGHDQSASSSEKKQIYLQVDPTHCALSTTRRRPEGTSARAQGPLCDWIRHSRNSAFHCFSSSELFILHLPADAAATASKVSHAWRSPTSSSSSDAINGFIITLLLVSLSLSRNRRRLWSAACWLRQHTATLPSPNNRTLVSIIAGLGSQWALSRQVDAKRSSHLSLVAVQHVQTASDRILTFPAGHKHVRRKRLIHCDWQRCWNYTTNSCFSFVA